MHFTDPQMSQIEKEMDKSVNEILTRDMILPAEVEHHAQQMLNAIVSKCTGRSTATATSRAGGSRHRRRPRSIQRGGDDHMSDWVTFACRVFIGPGAKEFTQLQLYKLVMFANIIKLLEINTTILDEDAAIRILDIISRHLKSDEILGAYVQSCLVTSLTISQEELASVAAKNFVVYALLSEINNYMVSIAGISVETILGLVVPKIINVASYLVTMPATITSVSGITLLGIIHGYFYPDPERIKWTIQRPDASAVSRVEHVRTIATALVHNRFLATKNLFLATIKQFANVISITRQTASVAKQILDGSPDALTVACRAIANKTLESMSGVDLETLKQMSGCIHLILTEIGSHPAYTGKVNQVLNMNIDCTGDDVAAVQHCKLAFVSPALQPAAVQLNALNETAAVASSASASTSPSPAAATAAAAPAAVVLRGSHPQGVSHSKSIHREPVGAKGKGGIVRLDPIHRANAVQSDVVQRAIGVGQLRRLGETRWGPPLPGKGGSSKHKKKHPRSTNKRKLLVKRIRRRSMKHKKKGKW